MNEEKKVYSVQDAIKKLRSENERNFEQTFDLVLNFQNLNIKKPENKFSKDVVLPHGRGKEVSVGVIGSQGVGKDDIQRMQKDRKSRKDFIKNHDFFVCEAPLMPLVGKVLGKYLGPKGKMPKPIPPNADAKKFAKTAKKSVRLNVRDSANIQVPVGIESMPSEEIKENIDAVIKEVKKTLPSKAHIKDAYLKLTMSRPVEISVHGD